jgi:hypothetical protein
MVEFSSGAQRVPDAPVTKGFHSVESHCWLFPGLSQSAGLQPKQHRIAIPLMPKAGLSGTARCPLEPGQLERRAAPV